jgi:hypothetical protein
MRADQISQKMRRWQLRQIAQCFLTGLCVAGVLFFIWFPDSQSGAQSEDYRFQMQYSDSGFQLEIYQSHISNDIHRFAVHLISAAANFSAKFTDLPNLSVSANRLRVFSFFPMNGEYRFVVTLGDSPLFSDTVRSDGFFEPPGNFTRIFCQGQSFLTRYCFVKKMCLSNRDIQFILPFNATFENIFLVPGARAPPFDPPEYRIGPRNISILNTPTSDFSEIPVIYSARFYNTHMLWHNIMDSLVPTFWTITTFSNNILDMNWSHFENDRYGIFINKTNQILLTDDFWPGQLTFLEALSDFPIVLFPAPEFNRCYKTVSLGTRKTELAPVFNRRNRDGLIAPYEIDPRGVRGLREVMLESTQTSVDACEPSVERPLVVIIARRSDQEIRRIINQDALEAATKDLCPFCDVQVIDFENMEIREQVQFSCRISLLLGIHGSGLIHVTWMKRSSEARPTGVVEFFPYKYTCRDWYEQCARLFGVQHFAVHTLSVNQSSWESFHNATKVKRCHTQEGECLRVRCHDFLRDQSILVDTEYFKSITKPFFDSLQRVKAREEK